mgnify:CR=1 FL=1
MDMWEALLKEHDEVVYIPMTSGLSTSCHSAVMLAEEYDGRVHVVDNHRISVTQAQSVLDAVELTRQGFTGAQIKEILETEAMDATIYIAVDTLEYLKKRRSYHSSSCCHRNRIEFKAGSYHSGRQAGRLYQNPGNEVCF